MSIQKEDDILTKFTHKYNLDVTKFKIKENNFDLQYYDCGFEFKQNQKQFELAFAEILLNSGKQKKYFRKYVIAYLNENNKYEIKSFNYADFLINNMSIKYENETPSSPSQDAINFYKKLQEAVVFQTFDTDEGINQFIRNIETATYKEEVTLNNVYKLYNDWFNWLEFTNEDKNKISNDKRVQIFLCDILNNTIYNPKEDIYVDEESSTPFIYKDGKYEAGTEIYKIKSDETHKQFWENYKLPPTKEVYNYITEHRNMFFDDTYRKERGAQYTPRILVEKQWEIMTNNDLPPVADVIWLDFACGTCNLLMDVPDKNKCFVSTIDEGDVLISKMNGFNNCVKFDFLANNEMPKFMYKGEETDILKIIKNEDKPVVVVMNPPYEKKKYLEMLNKMITKLKNFKIFYYTIGTFIEKNEIFDYKCKLIDGMYTTLKIFGLTNSGISMSLLQFGKDIK